MEEKNEQKFEFSAKEPSLGYFYQVKYGLLLLLKSDIENDTKILFESLDDIKLLAHLSINNC